MKDTKKTPTRLYIVTRPAGDTVPVRAVSEQQAKAHAASLDKYGARVAKAEDMLGFDPEDVIDAAGRGHE